MKGLEMEKSESITEITKALALFQTKVRPVYFDSVNPYYKSRYASLGKVIDSIREIAPDLGLSWVQLPISSGEMVGVETVILHTSGEYIGSEVLVPLPSEYSQNSKGEMRQANLVQEAGKYISYLRRYALATAFGLYTEEDTDGNAVVPPDEESTPIVQVLQKSANKVKKNERPYTPEKLLANLKFMAERTEGATSLGVKTLVGALSQLCENDENERHKLQKFLFGEESIKDVDPKMVSAAIAWLKPRWDPEMKRYKLSEYAEQEIDLILEQLY